MRKVLLFVLSAVGIVNGAIADCPTGYFENNGTCQKCPEKYPYSDVGASQIQSCYLITDVGKYVKKPNEGQASCDIGEKCLGGARVYYTRYVPVEYIETTGSQYIDAGIIGKTGVDMEIDAMRTDYDDWYNTDRTLIGSRIGEVRFYINYGFVSVPAYKRTIMFGLGPYAYDTTFYPQANTYYKAKMISATGEAFINDVLQKIDFISGANYPDHNINTNLNIYVGCSNIDGNPAYCGNAKIKSAKLWQDNILVRNFIPVKDTMTNKYGFYDSVSNVFFDNNGSGDFYGATIPDDTPSSIGGMEQCLTLPDNAYYSTAGTCDFECDAGYHQTFDNKCAQMCTHPMLNFLRTNTGIKIPLYEHKITSPSVVIEYQGHKCYANLQPGVEAGKIIFELNGELHHIVN